MTNKSFSQWVIEAARGDERAQYLVALALGKGFGVNSNTDESLAIHQALSRKTAAWLQSLPENGSNPRSPWAPRPIILLVDDSKLIRLKISQALEAELEGLVLEASDGKKAQVILEGDIRPDLIITDIHMPEVDGYGLIDYILKRTQCKNIPILVLSSDDSREAIIQGRGLGIKHWLLKSATNEQIVDKVRSLLTVPEE